MARADRTRHRHQLRQPPSEQGRSSVGDRTTTRPSTPASARTASYGHHIEVSDRRSSDDLANHPDADDRAIEALLAAAQTQCTAHQLASGLRWALPRTIQALERLDARLANTGQMLRREGHHTSQLAPHEQLIDIGELARCSDTTDSPSISTPPMPSTASSTPDVTSVSPQRSPAQQGRSQGRGTNRQVARGRRIDLVG